MGVISREEAMRLLKEDLDASRSRGDDERADACFLHLVEISNLPTVEERKEGEWIKVKSARGGYECSECHNYAPSYQGGGEHLSNFCPNCGAKMKGE